MNVGEARELLAYSAWANQALLASAKSLGAEELGRDLGASFGSVRGTLYHVIGGERVYLLFWLQRAPTAIAEDRFTDADALERLYADVLALHAEFLAQLTDDKLAAVWTHPRRGSSHTLAAMLQHVVLHGAYHRGQIATMLRQLGRDVPPTDLIVWAAERS